MSVTWEEFWLYGFVWNVDFGDAGADDDGGGINEGDSGYDDNGGDVCDGDAKQLMVVSVVFLMMGMVVGVKMMVVSVVFLMMGMVVGVMMMEVSVVFLMMGMVYGGDDDGGVSGIFDDGGGCDDDGGVSGIFDDGDGGGVMMIVVSVVFLMIGIVVLNRCQWHLFFMINMVLTTVQEWYSSRLT